MQEIYLKKNNARNIKRNISKEEQCKKYQKNISNIFNARYIK